MTRSAPDLRLPLALIAGAALLVGAFFLLFEKVEEQVVVEESGLAARNRHHAAERLLSGLGVATTSRYGLGDPGPTSQTILLLVDDDLQRWPMVDRLLPWVAAGGHLVVVPARESERFNLFDLFGVEELLGESTDGGESDTGDLPLADAAQGEPVVRIGPAEVERRDTGRPDEDPDDEALAEPEAPPQDRLLAAFGLNLSEPWTGPPTRVRVAVPGRKDPLRLRLRAVHRRVGWFAVDVDAAVEDPLPDIWVSEAPRIDSAVYTVLRRPHGLGHLTVLPEAGFLDNQRLEHLDHALALVELLRPARSPDRLPDAVLLVLTGDSPSILGLLLRGAWPALLSLGLLLLAWAWRAAVAFGPPLPDPSGHRRALLEHVDAVGHYLWRVGQGEILLRAARQRLFERLARRHPSLADQQGEARVLAVAARLSMLPDEVRAALEASPSADRVEFTRVVAALQRTWSRL